MTPFDIRYMANTTLKSFNKAFAFNWQNEENAKPVRSWKTFADKVLSYSYRLMISYKIYGIRWN